jgi:hypothetical protein
VNALEADRLVDAEDDRQRPVDLADRLEDPRVARLREALAAVFLVDVEPEDAALAERRDRLVADPALFLDRARVVVVAAVLAQRVDQAADLLLLGVVGAGEGEDEVVVDLAEEERLREGGDGVAARLRLLDGCGGFDAVSLPPPDRRSGAQAPAPTWPPVKGCCGRAERARSRG